MDTLKQFIQLEDLIMANSQGTKFHPEIKELIKEGTNRNILVFDSNAQPGEFTTKLVALMKNIYRRNIHRYPKYIFVSDTVTQDLDDRIIKGDLIIHQSYTRNYSVLGINFIFIQDLDEFGSLFKYFKEELNGSISHSDIELCMMLDENLSNPLLGSF